MLAVGPITHFSIILEDVKIKKEFPFPICLSSYHIRKTMASGGAIAAGVFFMVIALIGYVTPITDQGYSIPQADNLCQSGVGQISQFFSRDARENCSIFNIMTIGIYFSSVLGLVLTIVGAVIPTGSSKNKSSLICPFCNFVAKSETDLLDHKAKNHLDKSPYKCEHCDFIGITEEILWNHYNDNHPNEKKWK